MRHLALRCILLVAFLAIAVPCHAGAAKERATSAKSAATSGGCGDVATDSSRPEGLPLSRIMPQDDGCYDFSGGGKRRRCEPQCIPYARCRSGIDSCRIGFQNGPLTWFSCEEGRGNTAAVPAAGSVLILSSNPRRKMPTGHGLYVESVEETAPSLYRLILSHTNFDRRCSIETNIEAHFDQRQMTIDFLTGAWHTWGQDLAVSGFILGGENRGNP